MKVLWIILGGLVMLTGVPYCMWMGGIIIAATIIEAILDR